MKRMYSLNQNSKRIATLVLLVALMLPSAVQFLHAFDDHEHVVCTEVKTHIHQDVTDCDTCDFHLASFSYHIAEYSNLAQPTITVKINENCSSLQFHSFTVTNTQLRAPPVFS